MAVSLLSGLVLVIAAIIVIFIIFKLGKLIAGLLANIVLGFISLLVVNLLLGVSIPFDIPAIVITALLGVLGVFVLLVLKFIGITL